MNIYKEMVLLRDTGTNTFKDKTSDIDFIKFNNNEVMIKFYNSSTCYTYKRNNVVSLKDPKVIDITNTIVYIDDLVTDNIKLLLDFGYYIRVFDKNNLSTTYHKSRIKISKIYDDCNNIFTYLKKLSKYFQTDEGLLPLYLQYDKINRISEDSVLATYLSKRPIINHKMINKVIFPFGLNKSQKIAVEKALTNQISIIEGPPGTGKTETILNIIANIICQGKTVGVVSNNNSAISNVQEKLTKNGFGFITALLGNTSNKESFFNDVQFSNYNIKEWESLYKNRFNLVNDLDYIARKLNLFYDYKIKIAKLTDEVSKYKVEQMHFINAVNINNKSLSKYSFKKNWKSSELIKLIFYFEANPFKMHNILNKIKMFFKYGIRISKFSSVLIDLLKIEYYKVSIRERENEIDKLNIMLKDVEYEKLIKDYQSISLDLFRANLYNKYSSLTNWDYSIKGYKYRFNDFIKQYPVILSTTHSILNSVPENYLFDYIVIDEASQVDIVTASIALACCKNVVIVGDVMQLSPIVSSQASVISDELFVKLNCHHAYNYSKYSIIQSFMELYGVQLPKTLLNEHYRCHPKIIGFCNAKYYDNQLVVMTNEKENDNPLKIYKTAPGNHARKDLSENDSGWFNLRQIEVIKDEVLCNYSNYHEVGIISPYRRHVIETNKRLDHAGLEVDTIHRFQGREKKTIIFTTVANNITPFVDDANLINVAVSRAVDELIVVTSHELYKKHGSNLGDLIRYIEYNSPDDAIIESKKTSVFDLLYSDYSNYLLKFMKNSKKVSEYSSENLMYNVIDEVLNESQYKGFSCVLHVPLSAIIRNTDKLTENEINFTFHPWTHVDFLIYNKLDKQPVLVVEVDGYSYHKNIKQQKRDNMKDEILKKYNIDILRISTNESGEKDRLKQKLDTIILSS